MIADLYIFEVQQMVFQEEHNDWQTVHFVRVAWNVFSNYTESVLGGKPCHLYDSSHVNSCDFPV